MASSSQQGKSFFQAIHTPDKIMELWKLFLCQNTKSPDWRLLVAADIKLIDSNKKGHII